MKYPPNIKQRDNDNINDNITPTLFLYFIYILLNKIFEITLTILDMHNINPIINAVFSTLKFFNNSCCINNFPFDCPEFTIG